MKKIVHAGFAAAVLILAAAAQARTITSATDAALKNAVLVDFDALPNGSASSYVMGAVTFKSLTGSSLAIMSHGNQYGSSGQTLNNPSGQAFEAVFDTTVSAFGITGGAFNTAWTYTAYGVDNKQIETLGLNVPCCDGYFAGIAATGIKRVTFSGPGDWVAFDNFRFTASEVPEPGSLALLGLGVAGVVASRRKKA